MFEKKYKNLKYVISYPNDYDESKTYPVIFHMHGAGGRGDDVKIMNTDVPIVNNPANEEFIIVCPQCYKDSWFEIFEQVIEFCENIYESNFTDKSRFYGSGISMGGYGIYQMMMARPQLFTAGIVCCGGGMYWNASRLKDIKLRIFHGSIDDVVFPCESENMASKIKACGGDATLTIYDGYGHNVWERVYSNKENFDWLKSHKK